MFKHLSVARVRFGARVPFALNACTSLHLNATPPDYMSCARFNRVFRCISYTMRPRWNTNGWNAVHMHIYGSLARSLSIRLQYVLMRQQAAHENKSNKTTKNKWQTHLNDVLFVNAHIFLVQCCCSAVRVGAVVNVTFPSQSVYVLCIRSNAQLLWVNIHSCKLSSLTRLLGTAEKGSERDSAKYVHCEMREPIRHVNPIECATTNRVK